MKSKCNIKIPAEFICKLAARQGFTLIEVIISMFLMVVALFAIMATTDIIIKENGMNKMRTTAITLAKDKMEFLKNKSYVKYTDTTLNDGTYTDYATIGSAVQTTATGAFYMRTWTITNNSPAADMKTIRVTVSWIWMGITKNVILDIIVSE